MTDGNPVQSLLSEAENKIRDSGLVAPFGVAIVPYSVTKIAKNGRLKQFAYYKLQSDKPIFESKKGKTRYIHLGKPDSELYQDWASRIARRNAINALAQAVAELAKLEE